MERYFFPDTTVLINFAVIDRLDLLIIYLSGQGRMTQAVQAEVRKSSRMIPHLAEFDTVATCGSAIELNAPADIQGVENLRKRFAGLNDPPTKHLGESETIHVMRSRTEYSLSRIVTEDRDAYRVAAALGLFTHNTMEVFQDLVANGELTTDQAFEMLAAIEDSPYERTLLERPKRPQDLLA
jgi:predicted nucleic acid-binding protein